MNVVYDTSVLATVVSRRDLILLLQADVLMGKVSLITSMYILDELERVLASKFGMTKQASKARTRLLERVADVVQPKHIAQVSRDAKDDPLIAAALAGGAEDIFTLDQDLLVLKEHEGVQILTPDHFKEIVAMLDLAPQ